MSEDLAWAAGFLDGEGHFGVVRRAKYGHARIFIMASQTDPRPLLRLAAALGGIVRGPEKRKEGHKPVWRWDIQRIAETRRQVMRLYPYLSPPKQEQIRKALRSKIEYDGSRPVRVYKRKARCIHGHEFTPENTYTHRNGRQCKTCWKVRDERRGPRTYGRGIPRGEDRPNAKLNGGQVQLIRRLAAEGVSRKHLGAQFGVTPQYISKIVARKHWKHVP